VVFPHTCDAIQRLSDIWRINIPFGFHLDAVLPVKLDTPSARAYMADILNKFRIDLGQALGREVTDEALRKALRTMNAIREAIRDLYELRRRSPSILAGRDLYTVVRASMIMERETLASLLSEAVAEWKAAAGAGGEVPAKRVLLAGGLCNLPDVYSLVEDAGGTVIWDDFCTGSRYFATLSDADAEPPMAAIANRLLERVVCPAKHGGLERRADYILLLVRNKEASGVVFVLPKFCDPHAFDYPHIKQRLDEAGIPNLLIEIDDPLPALGQLKTRFEAFLEML
jgi:benzoyl-CoA reductase/2-hydroxyglutaryl-CoA dehydratase subunit BcrC/BadD/HgdB